MTPSDVQMLLLAAGYYNGGIDGDVGPKTLLAVGKILHARASETEGNATRWSNGRRLIGAGQLVLKHAGYAPGPIDGYVGPNTSDALRLWLFKAVTGKDEKIAQDVLPGYQPPATSFPKQADCTKFYGSPGSKALLSELKMFDLPLPMRIDWNLAQRTSRVQLHSKCGQSAIAATKAVIAHYGETQWRKLGLDRNAGTYNHRKMRGGTSWSMHAYGCAWDIYAAPNGLTTRCPNALFCGEDYKAFFNIWEAHGWTSLGRAIGRDWMHLQAAKL